MTSVKLHSVLALFLGLSQVVNGQCYNYGYGYRCRRRGLLGGAIAGIVVGIVAFVLICLLLCLFMRRRRRLSNATYTTGPPMSSYASGPGPGGNRQPQYGPTNGDAASAAPQGPAGAAVPPQSSPAPPQYTKYDPPPGAPSQNVPGGNQTHYQPPAGAPPTAPAPTYNPNAQYNVGSYHPRM
ncbi:hypothetical protein OE88DRAFT_1647755 [Heliocybe sulcata]|uniref:Uncharacterized protein n=1 Tax=Heliocybe sulcata TaxID=5364 RepID=A0A5C3MQD6_9AGAM|nr:hypothetical protein OE88DRAFT_1647755 [Heliocybe sulcata]